MRNPFQSDLGESVRGCDLGDFIDSLWANAFGTGLGSAEAPEPVKPSPPFGCHPISQVSQGDPRGPKSGGCKS
jgi:hypothetical protein